MGRQAPFLAVILAFSMVSLLGLPPTVGFMGKLYIFSAAIKSDLTWLALVGVLNSAVSAYYYLRVIRVMYMSEPEKDTKITVAYAPQIALYATGLGILILGILPGPLMELVEEVSETLFCFHL